MIAIIGSIIFFAASVLYILIALGLPYGDFAMGGRYKTMPLKMRYLCGFSVLVQWFAILILLQTAEIIPLFFSENTTKGLCVFWAIYISINSIMNATSKSKKEKYIITPMSVITGICFWITAFTN